MAVVFPVHIRIGRPAETISIVNATQLMDCIGSLSKTGGEILYPVLVTDLRGSYTVVRNNDQLEKLMTMHCTNT